MVKILEKTKGVLVDVKDHWSKPAPGNHVSYKEILSFGVGGMGQQFVTILIGYLAFSTGNTLLGSTLGIRPMHLQYMLIAQQVLNVFFYFIRGKIVDNTRTKWGRFRPYIAFMGFPLLVMAAVFIFLPFDRMPYSSRFAATFAFGIATSMIAPLFTDTYAEMGTVISPNSQERTKVIAIQTFLFSVAPTLTGFLIPLLSNMTGGYTDIRTYRFILVPFAVAGVSLNLFTAFGCKERIVTSESYVQRVGMLEGCMQIYRNKYWWLRTLSGLIGFLEVACSSIFLWIYMYATQDMTSYAFINTIMGTAGGIAIATTPILLSKLGNRKLLLAHNGLNVVFVALMACTFRVPLLFCVFWYLNNYVNNLPMVYNQVMHSEVKDYQQYLSRTRMDFTFGAAGMIILPLTLATGLVIPYIYECLGLTTNYDVLFDPQVRNTIFLVMCVLSIIGAIMNLVPFFFYDLSREKHRNIMKVLEYRAMLEDYEHGCLKPDRIKSVVEGIREANSIAQAPEPDIAALKNCVREARACTDKQEKKQAVQAARKAVKDAKKLEEQKEAVFYIIKELNQFENPETIRRVKQAEKLLSIGFEHLTEIDITMLHHAKALPNTTTEEKQARKDEIRWAKKLIKMAKNIRRYYANGIAVPDETKLDAALAMPSTTKAEAQARNKAIKAEERKMQAYYKIFKPYLEAQELVKLSKTSKEIYHNVELMYEDACAQMNGETREPELAEQQGR